MPLTWERRGKSSLGLDFGRKNEPTPFRKRRSKLVFRHPRGTAVPLPKLKSSEPPIKIKKRRRKKWWVSFLDPVVEYPVTDKELEDTMRLIEMLPEFALRHYNKINGTDFQYVRCVDSVWDGNCYGYCIDFVKRHFTQWLHCNIEARRPNDDPEEKPLLLFAEVYADRDEGYFSALSLVKPTDTTAGCPLCCGRNISHPSYGFRAGFDSKVAVGDHTILSNQSAAKLAKFAIQDYNVKNEANLKFVKALKCVSFSCDGLLMDFTVKNTIWVHMNFEAKAGEDVVRLFGELYLGDDDEYVLASLSPMEPSDEDDDEAREMVTNLGYGSRPCCPLGIYHPWRGFLYGF